MLSPACRRGITRANSNSNGQRDELSLAPGVRKNPATASAPFVATLVDVAGLIIYFSVAYVRVAGSLL